MNASADGERDRAARPLLLRVLPPRLRWSAWSRLYRGRHAQWLPLYRSAPLAFAPAVTMQLVPGDVISDAIAFTGIYELLLTRRVSDAARRGGTMIEVGANLGYFSLLWAAARAGNRCIAFEPSPRNIELLRGNVARNDFEGQIRVVPNAAAESERDPRGLVRAEQTPHAGARDPAECRRRVPAACRLSVLP